MTKAYFRRITCLFLGIYFLFVLLNALTCVCNTWFTLLFIMFLASGGEPLSTN